MHSPKTYQNEDYLRGRDDALKEIGQWLLLRIETHKEMRPRATMQWTKQKIDVYIDAARRMFDYIDFLRGHTEETPTRRQSQTELRAVMKQDKKE